MTTPLDLVRGLADIGREQERVKCPHCCVPVPPPCEVNDWSPKCPACGEDLFANLLAIPQCYRSPTDDDHYTFKGGPLDHEERRVSRNPDGTRRTILLFIPHTQGAGYSEYRLQVFTDGSRDRYEYHFGRFVR